MERESQPPKHAERKLVTSVIAKCTPASSQATSAGRPPKQDAWRGEEINTVR